MALFLVILLSIFLRFFQLGQNPPSLTWDEAAWGYNAYALGIDGKDEFGRFLPYNYLESFGDFKPPVYAYLDILPVKIFGLNEFAVRFPSALFGVLTVLVTYFLVKRILNTEIWKDKFNFKIGFLSIKIPIITSFILAISPWHINLSRAAFEANVATFLIVSGVWLFLGGAQNKKWYLPLSAISFALSFYTFNTARIVVPILVSGLVLGYWKNLFKIKKEAIIAFIVGFTFLLPIAQFLLSPQASLRFREVNIFSDPGIIEKSHQEIINDNNAFWSKILHNRRVIYLQEFLRHYFDHLSPDFLFIKGDGNPKFSTQQVGQLYLWESPFFIIGLLFLFKIREGAWWIIPFWLMIGIIPAATARETPHALRIETTLPTFQILTAIGLGIFLLWITSLRIKKYLKILIFVTTSLLILGNFIYYYHGYYVHYPREFSAEWQYGYKDAIDYIKSVENNYNKIYFTDKLGRPYIYFLFYTRYDPSKFRKEAVIEREAYGFVHVLSFGKYYFVEAFRNVKLPHEAGSLYIDFPDSLSKEVNVKKTFYLLNNTPVLSAYTF